MINEEHLVLARRYARALVTVTGDQLSIDDCIALHRAAVLLRQHRNWLGFFEAPSMTEHQRERMIILMQERLQVPFACEKLVCLLLKHRRMILLPEVLDTIAELYFQEHNVELFTVSSAPELSMQQLECVREFLARATGRQIMYTYRTDKTLIAGIRAQSLTALWEYSLAKKLREAYRLVGG